MNAEEQAAREYFIGVSVVVIISTAFLWAFKIIYVGDIMPWWMASIIAILWLAFVAFFWLQEVGPRLFLVACNVSWLDLASKSLGQAFRWFNQNEADNE